MCVCVCVSAGLAVYLYVCVGRTSASCLPLFGPLDDIFVLVQQFAVYAFVCSPTLNYCFRFAGQIKRRHKQLPLII